MKTGYSPFEDIPVRLWYHDIPAWEELHFALCTALYTPLTQSLVPQHIIHAAFQKNKINIKFLADLLIWKADIPIYHNVKSLTTSRMQVVMKSMKNHWPWICSYNWLNFYIIADDWLYLVFQLIRFLLELQSRTLNWLFVINYTWHFSSVDFSFQ